MLLNLHSHYSLRYGTLPLKKLAGDLLSHGYDTAVLTDINNSSAVLDFIRICTQTEESGLPRPFNALAGMEYRNGDQLLYIGIARNNEGFRDLNELMTTANRTKRPLPVLAPAFSNALIIYPYGSRQPVQLSDNEFIGIRPEELKYILRESRQLYQKYVILHPVSFGSQDFNFHKQLRAIDNNILISQLKPEQHGRENETLIPKQELLDHYRHFPELIRNTENLLAQCSFSFDFKQNKNKKTFTGASREDRALLHQLTMEGFPHRYATHLPAAMERVRKELEIIDNLNFSSYFLITNDICNYARSRNFHYVGRGSGANSIVAYCLGITDVCPIELDLYFERFLNPKRSVPPDFDIDFSWNERDDIYDYIFRRYPEGNVALMGAMSTFQSRAIIRELGKIYGLPKGEIDRLVHEPEHMLNKNEITRLILEVQQHLMQAAEDFPNQRTIHASGVLISELPLGYYTALDYPPKGLPVTQFDMHVAEDIHFDKFDILSQRGIGHIKDCREIVRENRGIAIDTSHPQTFLNDPQIADQLRSANTIGCFYIESPAMRQLLTKLKCDNYLTLVAASSIIRPGVASSGMMKAYIERHHHPEKAVYPHPIFKQQLEETYGVMVYQEDVMKIGHYYGGLDLSDADVLRRLMSGKSRKAISLLGAIRDKFFDHCRQQQYPEDISREIWRQMESFAGYSFNKAHSASFAIESYQSLYLKTYYPLEFMVSVLNNYGGFYQRKVYVNEARRAGGNICLPCVNKGQYTSRIEGKDIYLGFDFLLNLESRLAHHLVRERTLNGPYTSLENFILRTGSGLEQLIILIRSGAFRFTGTGKKELLWEAHLLVNGARHEPASMSLFDHTAQKPQLPRLETSLLEDLYDEIELIGFPVSDSLFSLAKSSFRGEALANNLVAYQGKTIRMTGDLIATKTVRTKNGSLMKFGTFLDSNGDFLDTVHFPPSLQAYPLNGSGLYLILGKVVLDFGCPSLEVTKCARMPLKTDPRSV